MKLAKTDEMIEKRWKQTTNKQTKKNEIFYIFVLKINKMKNRNM